MDATSKQKSSSLTQESSVYFLSLFYFECLFPRRLNPYPISLSIPECKLAFDPLFCFASAEEDHSSLRPPQPPPVRSDLAHPGKTLATVYLLCLCTKLSTLSLFFRHTCCNYNYCFVGPSSRIVIGLKFNNFFIIR